MLTRTYELNSEDEIPVSSFFDEAGIPMSEADLKLLTIKLELEQIYYEGESPAIFVTITYK